MFDVLALFLTRNATSVAFCALISNAVEALGAAPMPTGPDNLLLPVTEKDPVNSKFSKSNNIFCADISKILPLLIEVNPPDITKDPDSINNPIFAVEFVVIADSIDSPLLLLPDL